MSTFADVLAAELRREPGRPLVTFYDLATGERTELSVATYANWVAKAASLLVDEHGLERGDTLLLDLPDHWLATVFLGAAWTAGLTVALPDGPGADSPDVIVTGPQNLDAHAPLAAQAPVLACALLPLGVRFAEPLPDGVHDVGVEVWGQPDAFSPYDPPTGDDQALSDGTSQAQLTEAAARGSLLTDGGRLLVVSGPASPPDPATLVEPLARGGSVVLVVGAPPTPGPLEERVERLAADERITHRAR
ncbi:TIGR03089 family protein [Nocardioides acrostichi]|uniref:TIGR03089 family protein n=1 Tax=Nocardioides acrostichi TaxID=2784339 RepID=A0A930V0L6_9ACTN|nr:TIGR03089 family protein [Nocardioides acrostichi]MBF4161849.1 TIGR03089 family protein [Nocardioides acrostichi]